MMELHAVLWPTVFGMNGPEHFVAAERFLEAAVNVAQGGPEAIHHLAIAQVHATLAFAAATAMAGMIDSAPGLDTVTALPTADALAWRAAAGVSSK
jgi:hypothetical protein